MNFWDLCVAIARAIGRACAAAWDVVARMIRLTWRYWWTVLPVMALAIGAAIYYSRPDNICYRVNAIAFLNGPSVQQFEQKYNALQTGYLMDGNERIAQLLNNSKVEAFTSYRVVDCMHDGTADLIDFKRKSSPTDTLRLLMDDRLCLQFRLRAYCLGTVAEVENALLEWLNADEAMQQSYAVYVENLKDQVVFDHKQTVKLDSLTSAYYYNAGTTCMTQDRNGTGVNFYGDRRIRLFLNDIYRQQKHVQLSDYRLQLATAPVTLENHFTVDPKPVHSRTQIMLIFCLLGWIAGCVIAQIIDKRKAIYAWLKQ